MGYSSAKGRRPAEFASKAAHSHVVNDAAVQQFLAKCSLPSKAGTVVLPPDQLVAHIPATPNPIHHVIAIDGGYTEVAIETAFPSSTLAFIQFGALVFSVADLDSLGQAPFIDPDDMDKLRRIQRLKLPLPVRAVTMAGTTTLTESVRKALYEFFLREPDDEPLMRTLQWFIFEEYKATASDWSLAGCPSCDQTSIKLTRETMSKDFAFACPQCKGAIYLTDTFRFHERVDDELGASGILAYVTTAVEQLILVHMIRLILRVRPDLLRATLFIKDGPLAFFGQTANMHEPMRQLVAYLLAHHGCYVAGLEKSGAFVEHAMQIASLPQFSPGTILVLNNRYIYKYILPSAEEPADAYGRSTYFGQKVIFKTHSGGMHVVTLASIDVVKDPQPLAIPNMMAILTNIEKLRCDMYDNALVPISLVNKLVSLANHPSSRILQRFATDTVAR